MRKDYREILQDAMNIEKKEKSEFIRSHPLIRKSRFKMDSQIEYFKLKQYRYNDVIYKEGTTPQNVYLIKTGSFSVLKRLKIKRQRSLTTKKSRQENQPSRPPLTKTFTLFNIGPHQLFGEEEILDERKRNVTVQCKSSSALVYVIEKNNFLFLFDSIKSHFQVHIKKKNKLLNKRIRMVHQMIKAKKDIIIGSYLDPLPSTAKKYRFERLRYLKQKNKEKARSQQQNTLQLPLQQLIQKKILKEMLKQGQKDRKEPQFNQLMKINDNAIQKKVKKEQEKELATLENYSGNDKMVQDIRKRRFKRFENPQNQRTIFPQWQYFSSKKGKPIPPESNKRITQMKLIQTRLAGSFFLSQRRSTFTQIKQKFKEKQKKQKTQRERSFDNIHSAKKKLGSASFNLEHEKMLKSIVKQNQKRRNSFTVGCQWRPLKNRRKQLTKSANKRKRARRRKSEQKDYYSFEERSDHFYVQHLNQKFQEKSQRGQKLKDKGCSFQIFLNNKKLIFQRSMSVRENR